METITKAIWGEKHQNDSTPASEEPVSGAVEDKNNTDSTTLLGSGNSENTETSNAISVSAAADSQTNTPQEITLTPNNTPSSVPANTIDTTSTSTHPHPENSSIKQQQQPEEDADHPAKTKGQTPATQEKKEKTEPATQPSPKETPRTYTPKGTGRKYIRSTGMAADGGDFDATRPGAGREADRLLEKAGAHQGPPAAKNDHDPADDPLAARKGLGLGGKIKGMVYPHHHDHHADGNADAKKGSGLGGKVREKIQLAGKH
ncbi:MAG: hypothetical protein M1840_006600 [Geoglossum simile]|nr:MAG: hypothetical protein M1840_006600 [Geoglossum simile]